MAAKCITYFSAVGGCGRTVTILNNAVSLARQGKKVLLWDLHLSSPSLTFSPIHGCEFRQGTTDLLGRVWSWQGGGDMELKQVLRRCVMEWKRPSGEVNPLILAAGPTSGFGASLAAVRFERLFAGGKTDGSFLFQRIFVGLTETLEPDYILIDSPTGFTDISGIAAVQFADLVVLIYPLTYPGLRLNHEIYEALNSEKVFEVRRRERPIKFLKVAVHPMGGDLADSDKMAGLKLAREIDLRPDILLPWLDRSVALSERILNDWPTVYIFPYSDLALGYKLIVDQIKKLADFAN